jgi:hypothetical protein
LWDPGEVGEDSFGGPENWKLGVGMKEEIDLGLSDVRCFTEIFGRSLGSKLDFDPGGSYKIRRVP